jgi:hypothetical protein
MNRPAMVFVLMMSCALSGFAQTLTIGNDKVPIPIDGWLDCYASDGPVHTDIDLAHPATATGTIFEIGFMLSSWAPACENAVKIKFFRRDGDTLTVVADRGPFSWILGSGSQSETTLISVSPPVRVEEGDLIGITPLTDCGCVVVNLTDGEYLQFSADLGLGSRVSVSAGEVQDGALVVSGTGTTFEHPSLVLPVVASGPGAMGSNWKTNVQLHNPHAAAASGRLVFHRAGAPGTHDDPSTPYFVAPGATEEFADIVRTMGESGVGSMDVVADLEGTDARPPVVVANIFDERGDGGTVGLMVEAIDPDASAYECSTATGKIPRTLVVESGGTAFLVAPGSASRARFNVGVRTLDRGATLVATIRDSAGTPLGTATRKYPANYFKQLQADQFVGVPLTGGESIRITVRDGSAIIYGTSIDNLTNDSTIQFAHRVLVDDEG